MPGLSSTFNFADFQETKGLWLVESCGVILTRQGMWGCATNNYVLSQLSLLLSQPLLNENFIRQCLLLLDTYYSTTLQFGPFI